MANVIPNSFRGELFSGTHNFASGGDSFKIALYTGSIASVYTTASTVVSSTNEVNTGGGSNYSRQALSSQAVASSTAVAQLILEIQLGRAQLLQQRLQLFIMMIKEISYV